MPIADPLLSLLFPQNCHLCADSVEARSDGVVCAQCWQKTRIFDGSQTLCDKCSEVLSFERGSMQKAFCHRCDEDHFDRARAAGVYEEALYAHVIQLKEKPFLPARLRHLLWQTFSQPVYKGTTRIIPVPLSGRRLKERGFNQAAVIAHCVGKKAGIGVDELSLLRKVHTDRHRAGMDRKARRESVANAFEVKRPRLIKDENILLVDDIFTTGATVSNCAKTLKKAGANTVNVLTIARAV